MYILSIFIFIFIIILIILIKFIYTFYYNYKYASLIIPKLWVGNRISSLDKSFLQSNNIHLIINCSKNLPFTELLYINKYRLKVDDDLSKETHTEILKRIPDIIELIDYYIKNNKGVLIHCHAGMQRAPTVASCYLMNKYNLNVRQVINFIKSKRKIAFLTGVNYYNTLIDYYNKIT